MPPATKFSALIAACLLTPVVWLMLLPPPPAINFFWDWANSLGYLALAACLVLFLHRGRPQAFPPYSGRFFANLHRHLGYVALIFLLGHVGVLLVIEPLLLEHLKPTAPLHMLSGLAALILMLLLVVSSIPLLRRRLWRDYHRFRHVHALLAVAVLGLAFYHVTVSGFYLNRPWKLALLAAVCLGILAYYATGKYSTVNSSSLRRRNSAGYARAISYGCMILVAISCAALIALNAAQ